MSSRICLCASDTIDTDRPKLDFWSKPLTIVAASSQQRCGREGKTLKTHTDTPGGEALQGSDPMRRGCSAGLEQTEQSAMCQMRSARRSLRALACRSSCESRRARPLGGHSCKTRTRGGYILGRWADTEATRAHPSPLQPCSSVCPRQVKMWWASLDVLAARRGLP